MKDGEDDDVFEQGLIFQVQLGTVTVREKM
jgi:hypothetical protein